MTYWSQGEQLPVTIRQLVRFTGLPVRIPPSVVELLGALHKSGDLLGLATVEGGQEGEQKTADVYVKLVRHPYSRRYGLGTNLDDIYEALEGAGSERLLIRAHLREVEGPSTRFLALDESELLATDGLSPESYADEDETWLLTTEGEMFGEYAEEFQEALDAWEGEHGARPRLQALKVRQGRGILNLEAVEMPVCCMLGQAREFAERQPGALVVRLAPRQAEQRRESGGVYEPVSEMARRLRRRT